MAEVRAVPWNGFRVASTFSGGGGSSCGYAMAGFKVAYANEFVPAARDTYRANFPDTYVDERDIRKVSARSLMKHAGVGPGELDLLDGSPPCASFSTAGNRDQDWGKVKKYSDTEQRTDDLFFEFARLVNGVRPKAFVAENVSGLVKGKAKGYFKEILAALEACGYVVVARLLDAQWLGVPQSRQRLIFVGVRADLRVAPAHPSPLPYRYSIREAIGMTVIYDAGRPEKVSMDITDRPSPTITAAVNGGNRTHYSVKGAEAIGQYAIGDEAKKLLPGQKSRRYYQLVKPKPDEPCPTITARGGDAGVAGVVHPGNLAPDIMGYAIGQEYRNLKPGGVSRKYLNMIRANEGTPSPTITAHGGNPGAAGPVHWEQPRKFTIDELKLICSFPADFVITGTYAQRWERLGRAVPPLMMRAVAEAVRDRVLAKL